MIKTLLWLPLLVVPVLGSQGEASGSLRRSHYHKAHRARRLVKTVAEDSLNTEEKSEVVSPRRSNLALPDSNYSEIFLGMRRQLASMSQHLKTSENFLSSRENTIQENLTQYRLDNERMLATINNTELEIMEAKVMNSELRAEARDMQEQNDALRTQLWQFKENLARAKAFTERNLARVDVNETDDALKALWEVEQNEGQYEQQSQDWKTWEAPWSAEKNKANSQQPWHPPAETQHQEAASAEAPWSAGKGEAKIQQPWHPPAETQHQGAASPQAPWSAEKGEANLQQPWHPPAETQQQGAASPQAPWTLPAEPQHQGAASPQAEQHSQENADNDVDFDEPQEKRPAGEVSKQIFDPAQQLLDEIERSDSLIADGDFSLLQEGPGQTSKDEFDTVRDNFANFLKIRQGAAGALDAQYAQELEAQIQLRTDLKVRRRNDIDALAVLKREQTQLRTALERLKQTNNGLRTKADEMNAWAARNADSMDFP